MEKLPITPCYACSCGAVYSTATAVNSCEAVHVREAERVARQNAGGK